MKLLADPARCPCDLILRRLKSFLQEYITLIHACLRIAVPFALISSYSTPFELKHALSLSKATRLFVGPQFMKSVRTAAAEAGIPQDRIYLIQDASSRPRGKAVKGKAKQSLWGIIEDVRGRKLPLVDIRPARENTLAYLVFSSGTSGLPKGLRLLAYHVRCIFC